MPDISETAEDARIENRAAADFESLFSRYAKPVWSFLYSLIGNRDLAEELTQETFVRAFMNFGARRDEKMTSSWVFGIAHNVAREWIRDKYRMRRPPAMADADLAEIRDVRRPADEKVLAAETARKIQSALLCLNDDQRVVFILKMIYRLRYDEISSILGASVGKLKTDLHRARLEMQRKLMPYVGSSIPGMRGEL